jgi:L-lactate utilization protein LutC
MDREAPFLLALGLLIAAAAFVSATGWILLARDRRAVRAIALSPEHHHEAAEEH